MLRSTELGLLKSAPSELAGSSVVNLLARLQPHAGGDSSRNFIHNVKAATAMNWQVVPPACGAFGLTAWLRDTVADWV